MTNQIKQIAELADKLISLVSNDVLKVSVYNGEMDIFLMNKPEGIIDYTYEGDLFRACEKYIADGVKLTWIEKEETNENN